MNKEDFKVKNPSGETLVGERYFSGTSNKVIIIIHGYATTRKESYSVAFFSKTLADQGHDCISFDLSGNGESEGNHAKKTITAWSKDVLTVINYANEIGYKHLAMLTTSLGDMSGLKAAAENNNIERFFLWTPAIHYAKRNAMLMGEDWDKDWKEKGVRVLPTNKGYDVVNKYLFIEDMKEYDIEKIFSSLSAPMLIVAGNNDDESSPDLLRRAAEIAPHATVIFLDDIGHTLTSEIEHVLKPIVTDWFSEW